MVTRHLVLGIDAAWTASGTSGIALMSVEGGDRRIIAGSSSYVDFAPCGAGELSTSLLSAAAERGGAPVDIVAIACRSHER
jgi:hypothetical protein